MRTFIILFMLLVSCSLCFADDNEPSTNSEVALREKLFQRFVGEMKQDGIVTNFDASFTNMMTDLFDGFVVTPSFGLRWDEVPAPTLTGSNALASVQAFVATNGWNMETNAYVDLDFSDRLKPIRGLPWEAIKGREFDAVTDSGILYVLLKGWHHNLSGIAYNPNTNFFSPSIAGFLPIGQHWYVWARPEDPETLAKKYEGMALPDFTSNEIPENVMEKLPGLANSGKYDEALNLIRPYAEKGNAEAQFAMATSFIMKGSMTNENEIVYWARKAAIQDYPQALGFMANAYQWGEYGITSNSVMAAMWTNAETNSALITKCLDYERNELKVAH